MFEILYIYSIYVNYPFYQQLLGPKVIQVFSCSTQLNMKFQLLIKTKIKPFLAFKLSNVVFIMLINVNIYERDNAQLS